MPTQLRRWDEAGHVHFLTISCEQRLPFFGRPAMRDIVVQCMAGARERLGFRWIGYVVMPEHVHWLIYPQSPQSNEPIPISTVLQSLKTSIGRKVKQAWRDVWRAERTLGRRDLDRWATARAGEKAIWLPRGIDFNVVDYPRLMQKLEYCHRNPITRGLVRRPEDWPWSSFAHYHGGESVLLRMDWNGSDMLD